jgi:peptidoglycan hydrolase-like protein with peptidoglycan-binding domain
LIDLRDIESAKRVQERLIELGFLVGAADGIWGARSRRALQEFKIAHGLGEDDAWDEATQEQVLTSVEAHANVASDLAFIGGWGTDAAECRNSPLTITARRAEAGSAACDFHSTQREASNTWRLQARCSSDGERWNAHIQLTLSGRKLTWSSERGTATYVRCLR